MHPENSELKWQHKMDNEGKLFLFRKEEENKQFIEEAQKETSHWFLSHITETKLSDPIQKQPPSPMTEVNLKINKNMSIGDNQSRKG